MPLQEMEHYLLVTDDPERTRDFYRDALGLTVGFRPNLPFPGYWLYIRDIPCIHIAEREAYARYLGELGIPISERARGTGPVDHIAFNGTGFEEMRASLQTQRIEFAEDTLSDIGLRQLFLHDPNGVKIELNFRGEMPA
jgi:catechol 2,3-dioxygenase-like lactoylglutathione lyase family enzyme